MEQIFCTSLWYLGEPRKFALSIKLPLGLEYLVSDAIPPFESRSNTSYHSLRSRNQKIHFKIYEVSPPKPEKV